MKLKPICIAAVCSTFSIISCKKNNDTVVVPEAPAVVYVAGTEYGTGNSNHSIAKYWQDGVAHIPNVDTTKDSEGYSVFVNGNDVYLAGFSYDLTNSHPVAKCWKNGTDILLPVNNYSSIAKSVFVSGTDVYVAGYEQNGTNYVAKYWKNGVATNLTNGSYRAVATAIFVSGNDVYVAGNERNANGNLIAKYWKNGVETVLSSDGALYTLYAEASAITVTGNDVYIAGNEYDQSTGFHIAKHWKVSNGAAPQLTNLTSGTSDAYASGVAVSNNKVYLAITTNFGTNGYLATGWKDGVASNLGNSTEDSYANAIAVKGNDVYVAGFEETPGNNPNEIAKYWKNGVGVNLTGTNGYAEAFGIFVK